MYTWDFHAPVVIGQRVMVVTARQAAAVVVVPTQASIQVLQMLRWKLINSSDLWPQLSDVMNKGG